MRKTFTVIEMLIVVMIIAILATLIVVALDHYKSSAKDARAKENMNQLRISADKIYNDEGGYKSSSLCCGDSCNEEVKVNCEEIRKMTGSFPEIFSDNDENFCAKVKLNNGNYYCVDALGTALESDTVSCSSANYKCK